MASAEARARWLHYANRCIVEEDYKGASRTPSSPSSSSKSESGENHGEGGNSYNSPSNTKWWLRQHPKGNTGSFWEPPRETFPMCMETEEDARLQDLEAVIGDSLLKKPTNGELCFQDDNLLDLDPNNCFTSEKSGKLSSEMESQWIGINKDEPWWRTADLNDIASFVSHKSLEHIDNCDLPRPQGNKAEQFFCDKGLASLGLEPEKEMSNFTDYTQSSPTSICMSHSKYTSGAIGCSTRGHDRPLSTRKLDEAENLHKPYSELSKTQLLEALCHSQTRAREAEKAAQQAYNEKEHVIALFLRQASQLFAYKQWLHILQLESLCLQLRNKKYPPIYTRFPDFVPWVPTKGKQQKKVRRKAGKRKPCSHSFRISKSVKNFLLGLTLAGAGMLLGWTLGWLFPACQTEMDS